MTKQQLFFQKIRIGDVIALIYTMSIGVDVAIMKISHVTQFTITCDGKTFDRKIGRGKGVNKCYAVSEVTPKIRMQVDREILEHNLANIKKSDFYLSLIHI